MCLFFLNVFCEHISKVWVYILHVHMDVDSVFEVAVLVSNCMQMLT